MVKSRQLFRNTNSGGTVLRYVVSRSFIFRSSFSRTIFLRPIVFALFLLAFAAGSANLAYGQFTLTISSPLYPPAVDPNQPATATLSVQPNGSSAPVTLTCVVTTTIQSPVDLPTCNPSPTTVTPPAQPSLTIDTSSGTSFGLYNFTITGTSGSFTQSLTVTLTVLNVSEDYTIAVLPTTASPSPVSAGSTATAIVTISAIGSYSGHQVTLSCLSVTPVVEAAPVCSFNPQPVSVTSGPAPTSTLTITTFGPAPTTRLKTPRIFYAIWFLIPGLGVVVASFGAGTNRKKRLMGLLLLWAIAVGIVMMPACGSSTSTNSPSGVDTPKNSYSFTLTGADENGAPPGNSGTCTTGTTCGQATVTLTVD
jgi:hypothetical protein